MADKKLNLHQKMFEVMKNIEYLKKDDKVEYKSTKYKAMSEEKVTMTVRKELINQGIIVYPIEQSVEKDGSITTTNTRYKMVNVDDPDDYIILASSGQGADTQDKGVGKAMTYSFKYMFLRTFAIPTGEDPDKVASEKLDDDGAVAEIKRLIMQTDTDTAIFLAAMSKKFKRDVPSVDDMAGKTYKQGSADVKELDYALMRIREKAKGVM